jgi:hypothetical protein
LAPAVAPLVHATVQELVRRAAHDVRNLMNGVAVNLEVVRSRSGRPGAAAASVHNFAEAASQQFESLCAVTEALLAITRPAREPADVAREWSALDTLRRMLPFTEGRTWRAEAPAEGNAVTVVAADAVRLALVAALLAALDAEGDVRCAIRAGEDVRFTIAAGAGDGIMLTGDVAAALTACGVGIERDGNVLTLTFPTRVG